MKIEKEKKIFEITFANCSPPNCTDFVFAHTWAGAYMKASRLGRKIEKIKEYKVK